MVGLWLLFTVALPASFATTAEALYPTPSRLVFLSEIREAQGETNRNLAELTAGFLMDHPDLTVGDEQMPTYIRAAFLSNEAARTATRPIVDEYEEARAGREQTIAWAQYLSPSVIAQRLLHQSAGADLERQHRFQAQAYDALANLAGVVGPAVVSRNRLSLSEFDAMDPFEFRDVSAASISTSAAGPTSYLLVIALLLVWLANRTFARDRLRD
jgi:ABC-2 type transport system permease protein